MSEQIKQHHKSKILLILAIFSLLVFSAQNAFSLEGLPAVEHLSTINTGLISVARVAVDDSNIYVSDPRRQLVLEFSITGKPRSSIGRFAKPLGVALDVDGNIYVGNDSENSVSLFDFSGEFIMALGDGSGEFEMPSSIAIDDLTNNIFVSDSKANEVGVYDKSGIRIFTITDLLFPTGIYVDAERRELLVSDSGNNEVKVYDLSGSLLRSFGSGLNEGGEFGVIYGLSVDRAGRIYVADSYRNVVLVFGSNGDFIGEIGEGHLTNPVDVAIDPFNRLLVASYGNSSVEIYGIDGGDVSSALLSINKKALYTSATTVDLSIVCRDSNNCFRMRFRNGGSSLWTDWETFKDTKSWELASIEGANKVYGQFEDKNGKITGHYATITLDTVSPVGKITIADGADFGNSATVDLSIAAVDNTTSVLSMRLSNDGIEWSSWESFVESKSWTLSNGYGTKTVYVNFKDAAGNKSGDFSDSIIIKSSIPIINNQEAGSSDPLKIYDFKSVRTDGRSTDDNLDSNTNNPRIDIEYTFEITIRDQTGEIPEYARLYMTQRSTVMDDDFYYYDLTCAGVWADGAVCSYTTKLGPASLHAYHFQAKLAGGAILRYPNKGELTGPQIELLNGGNLVGLPRNVLDAETPVGGKTAFGTRKTYRWVYDDNNSGKFELVDKHNPVKPGEGYLIEKEEGVTTLPLQDYYNDIEESQFAVSLHYGWNIISNPYSGNVKLSDVQVKRGDNSAISWSEAVKNGMLTNASYYYRGSDWGSTYSFESAGSNPDSTLVPWMGYWIYLNNSDETYHLIISKPLKNEPPLTSM